MSAIYNKGVPGIPLASLDAIQDENTRQVLRAMVDGWHVRNGSAGKGDSAFVTKGELASSTGHKLIGGGVGNNFAQGGGTNNSGGLTSGQINQVITDLQASVMESVLFKELGDRIKLIQITANGASTGLTTEITNRANADNAIVQSTTTQFATVNGNISALQTQQTTTANNVAALTSSVTTLQASVGTNTTAIQTEATARVNADNDIYAKYSVKIDTNGYVSGFGLISTANNSTPFSDFIVRANRFAIGSPSGPGITPKVPFIVYTTNQTMADGTIIPPGIYMDYAMVKRLDGAYINAGLLQAAQIYTGSQYVDYNSKQLLNSVAVSSDMAELISDTTTPWTSSALRFYGPDYHASVARNLRIRSASAGNEITVSVTAYATVDHYFTIWYRLNGGAWVPLTSVVEPQGGDGSASAGFSTSITFGTSQYIDVGVSGSNASGVFLDSSKRYLKYLTIIIQATNL